MDKIDVSQRAREEAADLWIKVDGDFVTPAILQEAERYRRGDYDHTPAVQAFARFERDILATRTDATPVALAHISLEDDGPYIDLQVLNGETLQPADKPVPLYTHPPATDVAALVEALVAHKDALRSASQVAYRDGKDTNWLTFRGAITYTLAEHHDTVNAARQAIAPFTKGQNDE